MNATDTLKKLGHLVMERRLEMGLAKRPFAQKAGIDAKTLYTIENGTRVPWETNQRKLEDALGWRPGSIQEVVTNADIIPVASLTLDYMKEQSGEASWHDLDAEETAKTRPVTRAGELSNEELVGELLYRLRNKNIPADNLPTLNQTTDNKL